jgi:hypothetical protein
VEHHKLTISRPANHQPARSARGQAIGVAESHLPWKPINAELTLPFFTRTLADMASQKKLLERSFQRFAATGKK